MSRLAAILNVRIICPPRHSARRWRDFASEITGKHKNEGENNAVPLQREHRVIKSIVGLCSYYVHLACLFHSLAI